MLHLLDSPDAELKVIPTDTIARADRLVCTFVLPHTRNFYATLSPDLLQRTQDIAAWLLTDAPPPATSGIHIRACRVSVITLNQILDPLVTGGWLHPENPYPTNNIWFLDPRVRVALAYRVAEAVEQRERNRRLAESIGKTE